MYLTSLSEPAKRTFLVTTESNAIYAPVNGHAFLLIPRGSTLMAQELDLAAAKLVGDEYPIADPVATIGTMGRTVGWASNSGQILYKSSGELSQLTWFDTGGRDRGTLGESGTYTYPFRISPDGRRVAAAVDATGKNDLWLLDVERGVTTRFTSSAQSNTYPIWSPDGRTIIFTRDARNLFRKDVNNSGGEQEVVPTSYPWYPTDWSRDGRFVLHNEAVPEGQIGIAFLAVGPDGKAASQVQQPPARHNRFNERYGRFFPEPSPHWIAYQSDESDRYQVYIQSFPEARAPFQISTDGGRYPEWGKGGKELFYVDPDNRLMQVDLRFEGDQVHPSKPRVLFELPIMENGWPPYDTTDGERFLVRATTRQASQAMTVIINWPRLLKKTASTP
jgi:hypothetical protein